MRSLRNAMRRRRVRGMEFCESCGEVCDTACRAEAGRDRLRIQAITYGLGITDLNIDR